MDNFDWRVTIKINIFLLKIVGLWPQGYSVYTLDFYFLYSLISTITIYGGHNLSQIINIFYIYSDLEALTATIFIAATNIFAVIKRYIFVKNLKTVKQLFVVLNSYNFRPKTLEHMKLIKASITNWKRAYFWFSTIVYFNVTLWSIIPVVNNWVKDHKLPFEAWYPFKTEKSPNYQLTYFYQLVCIWYITVANLNLDTFIYAFMSFIAIQCDILKNNLKNLSDKAFSKNLRECIQHHQEILSFAERSNNFFNFIILGQIATSTAALALTMFQLSVADFSNAAVFTQLAYLCGMCAEIFLYCWFGNEVQVKSSQIAYAVFKSEWIGRSQDALQSLIILCVRCQRPIKITAINLFTLSLETFLNILRSAWSYFALLATVNDK